MATVRYEDKLTIEIKTLESFLLDLSDCDSIEEVYSCINGRIDGKESVKKVLVEHRKNGGYIPTYEV